MKYFYRAWEVGSETYDKNDPGEAFNGGVLVEGFCDKDRNVLILVTRHEIGEPV